MITIQFDPHNPEVIVVNGNAYDIRQHSKKERLFVSSIGSVDFDQVYDHSADKKDWSDKTASEIFFDCKGRVPENKSEVTGFAVKYLSLSGYIRTRKTKGRCYLVPPLIAF